METREYPKDALLCLGLSSSSTMKEEGVYCLLPVDSLMLEYVCLYWPWFCWPGSRSWAIL